jgi:hypothetical protein
MPRQAEHPAAHGRAAGLYCRNITD